MAKRRRTALDSVPPPEEAHSPSAFDAEIRQRLLDLALDARSYLRQNARPAVRVSAALLLAASLAACSGDVGSSPSPPPTVALGPQVSIAPSGHSELPYPLTPAPTTKNGDTACPVGR